MKRLAVPLLLSCAGCDRLFALDHLELHGDSGTRDGVIGDIGASGDAPDDVVMPCAPGSFDEDGDGLSDDCDSCPTYVNTGLDSDGDGLDNACDRDDSPTGDRILFYSTFAQNTDLVQFSVANAQYSNANGGSVTLTNTSMLTTVDPFMPTRVEVHIGGITGSMGKFSELLFRQTNNVLCHVQAADCGNTNNTQTCVTLDSGGASGWPHLSSSATLISLYGSSQIVCSVTGPQVSPAGATVARAFTSSTFGLGAPNATVRVDAIVIYGAK